MNKVYFSFLLVMLLAFVFIGCDTGNGSGNGKDEFTVTFDSKGGSTVQKISGIKSGSTITLPPAPTYLNHHFDGWFLDDITFQTQFNSSTVITSDLTVFAKWTLYVVEDQYQGIWYAVYDDDEEKYLDPFEVTSTTIIYNSITYSGIYTQGGGTVTAEGGGVYTYFYQNDKKIGVAALVTTGGQLFLGGDLDYNELGSIHWGASPAIDMSNKGDFPDISGGRDSE